ncbi:conserved protein of unknown function [Tenacibaculum sp. 190524A02b]|uniref:HK97 family phage prohead protease n=1 Tax=Tenacibaculum vairaonense TaxID=3137860 RepID=UPI0032B12C3B
MGKSVEQERRMLSGGSLKVENRSEEDDSRGEIQGTAAKFNKRTKIGNWFYEEILPGAFDGVLDDDVRCLLNHNPDQILGRTKSGTLDIWVDDEGLKYKYLTPNRTFGIDLQDAIESGDVSGSSFSFRAEEVIWIEQEDDLDIRQIKKVGALYDVAPVTYPAYEDTSVAKRSYDQREKDKAFSGRNLRQFELIINKNKIK